MNYLVVEKNTVTYLEAIVSGFTIRKEQDILDFMAQCGEHNTNKIMLHDENLSEEYFDLKTKLAGTIMQKISQYFIQAAILIDERRINGRFGEMVMESRRSSDVRYFTKKDEAETWLTNN